MIRSMTGYGRATRQVEERSLTLELRSVNSRFLEIHARFPKECVELESIAKAKIKEVIRRGRVDLSFSLEASNLQEFKADLSLARRYLQVIRQLQEEFGLHGEVPLAVLLQMPGIVDPEGLAGQPSTETLRPVFELALSEALDRLQEFRAAEGGALAAEMEARLDQLSQWLAQIQTLGEPLLDYYRSRLEIRIRELLPQETIDPQRISMEAALVAEKSDIREEIVRLKSHMERFRNLLQAGGEAGKQLDFLLQEMNREANTILSKSGPADISRLGVQMKSEIEKLREQVQNVE